MHVGYIRKIVKGDPSVVNLSSRLKHLNMKLLILTLMVAYAAADVSHLVRRGGSSDQDAQILRQELDVLPDGGYQWAYETDNGISASESGSLKVVPGGEPSLAAQGEAKWTSPEGEQIQFQYVADENGYQPQGSHLPTPPPIPEAILRALEYIRAHPPPPEKK